MEDGQTCGHCEQVARKQPDEHDDRAGEQPLAPRVAREPDRKRDEQGGREHEAGSRARTLVEVGRHECAVDPRADGAREDEDVAPELGELHLTITSPSMSLLWSV